MVEVISYRITIKIFSSSIISFFSMFWMVWRIFFLFFPWFFVCLWPALYLHPLPLSGPSNNNFFGFPKWFTFFFYIYIFSTLLFFLVSNSYFRLKITFSLFRQNSEIKAFRKGQNKRLFIKKGRCKKIMISRSGF